MLLSDANFDCLLHCGQRAAATNLPLPLPCALQYRLNAGIAPQWSVGKLFKLDADLDAPEVSEKWPSDFPVSPLTTGTVDDDDDPADERAGENEAYV
jgi:hypothetical protein